MVVLIPAASGKILGEGIPGPFLQIKEKMPSDYTHLEFGKYT